MQKDVLAEIHAWVVPRFQVPRFQDPMQKCKSRNANPGMQNPIQMLVQSRDGVDPAIARSPHGSLNRRNLHFEFLDWGSKQPMPPVSNEGIPAFGSWNLGILEFWNLGTTSGGL